MEVTRENERRWKCMGAPIKFIKINNDIKDDVNNYWGTKKGENCATLFVYTQKFKINEKKRISNHQH